MGGFGPVQQLTMLNEIGGIAVHSERATKGEISITHLRFPRETQTYHQWIAKIYVYEHYLLAVAWKYLTVEQTLLIVDVRYLDTTGQSRSYLEKLKNLIFTTSIEQVVKLHKKLAIIS